VPTTKKSSAKVPIAPRRATSFEPNVAAAFGRVIRSHREQSGIAQDAFALKANVDRSYYGKLERGERQPSLALLLRIAGALDVAAGTLVTQTESEL
jgi:transcriptional regulator with XRE-family HTH domain